MSTKELEQKPGDMLKDPQLVYGNAEKMAAEYRRTREYLLFHSKYSTLKLDKS